MENSQFDAQRAVGGRTDLVAAALEQNDGQIAMLFEVFDQEYRRRLG